MNKFLTSLALVLAMATPTYATVASKVPDLSAPVTCPGNSATYELGKAVFEGKIKAVNGQIIAEVPFGDGNLAVVVDLRKTTASDVDPNFPFFVLLFDNDHCFVVSQFMSEGDVREKLGVVLASE